MRSTATALPRTLDRPRQQALSRLGPWHFAVLVAVLLLLALPLVMLFLSLLADGPVRLELS